MDYDHKYYDEVVLKLKQMYEGYEDYYYDLLYSLEPYELILFYEQVNFILTHPTQSQSQSSGGCTSHV
jgi:hypothetical protein